MSTKKVVIAIGLVLIVLCAGLPKIFAQEKTSGTDILDTFSSWRMFTVLKTPEIDFGSAVKPADFEQFWLNKASAQPPADWIKTEFDDSKWLRGTALMSAKSPFVARSCFRGKFNVSDPSRVKKLLLSLTYHGGAIIYINGEEVKRAHLPAGTKAILAEAYPLEAFAGKDGIFLAEKGSMVMSGKKMVQAGNPGEDAQKGMALWERTLLDIEVPGKLLQKGVNVLAVDVIRSPYNKIIDEKKSNSGGGPGGSSAVYDIQWNTCELRELRLSAAGTEKVDPNTERPAGFQVWNSSMLRGDFALDFGDPCETLQPIILTGVKNGSYSGKIVAGSNKTLTGLKATVSDLKGPAGTIPVSALSVRYGGQGSGEIGIYEYTYGEGKYSRERQYMTGLNVLDETVSKEVEVGSGKSGAVVPIWVTVKVPPEAAPGLYEGTLTVKSDAGKPVLVPVKLEVLDWKLPDPENFKTWIEMMQSPDTLQLEYGVEPWSDKHFELIGRSMRLLRQVGSGMLYVPLICETNFGNAGSMVRWIKKGEKKYEFDYTVMDKYLDTAEKNLGKPKIICFLAWDVYLLPKGDGRTSGTIDRLVPDRVIRPAVSVLDPASKKVKTEFIPNYDDPAMKEAWKTLFDGLHARLKKRGLEDKMMIGCMTDGKPSKEEIYFWKDVTGDLPWVSHAHQATSNKQYFAKVLGSGFKTGYMVSVYDLTMPEDPAKGHSYGWKNPILHAQYMRSGYATNRLPSTFVRCLGEINICGGQRGFGRLGGDYWDAVKDKRSGNRVGKVGERYPQSNWMNLQLRSAFLAPGPEGALSTSPLELLREGVQESEARIFIEEALTNNKLRAKLDNALAKRCEKILDDRLLYILQGVSNFEVNCYGYHTPWNWMWQPGIAGHAWFESSGWQERSKELYTLAAEVQKKLSGK